MIKNYEDVKRKLEKLEQENSLMRERIRDKELIIQLMRSNDS